MMARNSLLDRVEFTDQVKKDNPYKPGTLVLPRLGYFSPVFTEMDHRQQDSKILVEPHPCGIILGPSVQGSDHYVGKEFYRVRFGNTTYENVHPVQLEIVNEI